MSSDRHQIATNLYKKIALTALVDPTVQIATNEGIPIIDPSSVPSGVPVTLKCDTGGAAGVVQWLKDGIQIGDGQVITISGGASAKGNYACNFTPRGVNKRLKSKDIKLNRETSEATTQYANLMQSIFAAKDTPANTDRPSTPAGQKNGGSTKPPGLSGLWQKLFPG